MPSIAYNQFVPNPNNYPGNDIGDIAINAVSINSIWGVDHLNFSNANAGQHQQVTIPSTTTPVTQTGLSCVAHTQAGVADTSNPQLILKNSATSLPLSIIRAFGLINSGGIISGQSFNVSSVSLSVSTFTITLTSGCVTGINFAVICTNYTGASNVLITGAGVFTISVPFPLSSIAFIVLQI